MFQLFCRLSFLIFNQLLHNSKKYTNFATPLNSTAMKRIVLFSLLLIFAASSTLAQEANLPYPSTTALAYEKNKIYYEGNHISKRDCQAFLRLNAQEDIYRQYRSGLRMYNAGWGLLGTGLTLDAFAIGLTVGLYASFEQDPERPTMGPGLAIILISVPVGAAGLACNIAGIYVVAAWFYGSQEWEEQAPALQFVFCIFPLGYLREVAIIPRFAFPSTVA